MCNAKPDSKEAQWELICILVASLKALGLRLNMMVHTMEWGGFNKFPGFGLGEGGNETDLRHSFSCVTDLFLI